MCHPEPCDWRWQGDGATKPMTESCSEEGVISRHWLWQWLPAHVFFTGWQVQRSAWRWSSPWWTSGRLQTKVAEPPLRNDRLAFSGNDLKLVVCTMSLRCHFVTGEGGTVVSVRPLIRHLVPRIGKQRGACSRETLPPRSRRRGTVQATGS